jgi:hypothetical protein
MTPLEWSQSLEALAASPEWVAARVASAGGGVVAQRPAPSRWSAVEVIGHLRDTDRDVFVPRLERYLTESEPWFENVDVTTADRVERWSREDAVSALADWRTLRAAAVKRLERLSREDWDRLAFHSIRGPLPLAWTVRSWVDHDLAHRAQLGRALAGA